MKTLKTLCLFFGVFLFITSSHAQVGQFIKKNVKKGEKAGEAINDIAEGNTDQLEEDFKNASFKQLKEEFEKARNDFDTATFSYAIALSDNAGLFEEQERFGRHKDLVLMFIDKADLQQDETPQRKAEDHNNIGQMLMSSSRFRLAEKAFLKSKGIYESNGLDQNSSYTGVLSNLALLYHSTGRYGEAEKLTLEALKKREEILGTNNSAYAASMNNLAMIYKDEGKYTQAEKLINESLNIIQQTEGTQSTAYAILLNNKAILFQNMGRYSEAEELLKQSLSIAESSLREQSTNYQRLLVNLALLYQEMNRYQEAEQIYLEAIRRKEIQWKKNHPDYAHMLNNLAALYMLMERYEEVEKLLLEAKEIYALRLGKQHPAYASTINNLGNYYRIQGNAKNAEKLLKEALDIRKNALGENHPQFAATQEDLAMLYWQTGRYSEAEALYLDVIKKADAFIQTYFPAMSESEKEKYWNRLHPTFLRFYAFAATHPDQALLKEFYESHILTKALLLSSTNKMKDRILNSGETDLIQKYETWIDLKEQIAKYYQYSKEELAEGEIDLYALEHEANTLEKELSERSELFAQGYEVPALSFEDMQKTLNSDEVIVDIVQFPKFNGKILEEVYYAAIIITAEKQEPTLVLLENGSELEDKYFKCYRNTMQSQKEDKYSYQQFWSAIDAQITGKQKVYLSLDGVYNQLSINTLRKEDGTYLVDEKTFVLLTNSKDLYAMKNLPTSNSPNKEVTLLGFPNYGSEGQIAKLPGTKIEVEGIAQILTNGGYGTALLLENEAKEGNLKNIKAPRILHIATHGFFVADVQENSQKQVFGINPVQARENPLLRSGLMLANAEGVLNGNNYDLDNENGILTAYEAATMDLEGTEMVILSACETGLGDIKAGEGVYGLQRSFQVAGANTVVMSLWKVSDEATQKLMTAFYKYWLSTGNKTEAFQKAQLELKADYPHPYFWGAFVMIGG